MERLLKCLSVFLISGIIFLCSSVNVMASDLTVTKKDYETFYSYVKNKPTLFTLDAMSIDGKTFDLEFSTPVESNQLTVIGRINKVVINGKYEFTVGSREAWTFTYSKEAITKLQITVGDRAGNDNYKGFRLDFCSFNESNQASKTLSSSSKPMQEQTQYKNAPEQVQVTVEPTPESKPIIVPNIKPPKFDMGDGSTGGIIDGIINVIVDFFKELSKSGIKIIMCAIALGVTFICGRWLWRKLRQWLNNI